MHNASKFLMGSARSNIRSVDNRKGTIGAGLAVRLKSDDTLSVALADGSLLGISMGKDLANVGRTAIARKGLGIPVKLASGFTPTLGAQVHISDTTGEAAASGSGKTGVNAVYASGVLTGVFEDGTEANVALIDFPGGL